MMLQLKGNDEAQHYNLFFISFKKDLKQVYEGKLVPLARQAVTTGRQHILKCQVCSPRGFICEVCKEEQIIYPFQLGDTFTVSIIILISV